MAPTPAQLKTADLVPARSGKGKVTHYATAGRLQLGALCGYRTDQPLTQEEAAAMKPCTRCAAAAEKATTPAARPTVEAPAPTTAPDPVRIKHLDQDVTTPATMFDPELTYYADGTPVVMRWTGGERIGAAAGMTVNRGPYAYQAVRFEDGTTSNVAPHVLHRAEQAPAEAQPVRHLADYDIARTAEGATVHRITVTRDDRTAPVSTTDLPYDDARNAARTLEGLGWTITGMETYGGPNLFRAWVEPTPVAEAPADHPLPFHPLPFHGPDFWVGLQALCGYDDHTSPMESPGLTAAHPRVPGVLGSCPGSLRPARAHRDQPTSRHTAALSYAGPKPYGLAYWAEPGDVITVDGQDLTVKDCRPDESHPSRMNVIMTERAEPVTYGAEDRAEFRRRVRRHNVECQGCGVYASVETDEAVDGPATLRLCGMCDREGAEAPAVPMLMPDQARGIATRSLPGAHDFRRSYDAALRFLGYTFQMSEDAPVRYGWITPTGTYSRVGESTRAGARKVLPVMVLEDQRVAARAAAREEQQPARRVVEGVVVQHAGASTGSAPKHADHPDVTAARAVLISLLGARLGEHTELDGSDPDVRGYVIEPRGQGRVAAYWAEEGRIVRHDDREAGASLDCLEWTFQRAGWETERMTRSGLCLFAHNPAARPAGG